MKNSVVLILLPKQVDCFYFGDARNSRRCREINKLTSVFLCVCPVIDHEFRHHIAKVAVDPRDDSRMDPQTTFTML